MTDREGGFAAIGVDDILVVSPYNKQVNLLRSPWLRVLGSERSTGSKVRKRRSS
jgi:hypothetical protein